MFSSGPTITILSILFLRDSHVVCPWGAHPIFCLPWMNVVVLGIQSPSCVQLYCDPMDCRPPGSSVHGISQARILEWVTISSSRGSSWPRHGTQVSCIGRQILYHWATREALSSIPLSSTLTIAVSIICLGALPCWSHLSPT